MDIADLAAGGDAGCRPAQPLPECDAVPALGLLRLPELGAAGGAGPPAVGPGLPPPPLPSPSTSVSTACAPCGLVFFFWKIFKQLLFDLWLN